MLRIIEVIATGSFSLSKTLQGLQPPQIACISCSRQNPHQNPMVSTNRDKNATEVTQMGVRRLETASSHQSQAFLQHVQPEYLEGCPQTPGIAAARCQATGPLQEQIGFRFGLGHIVEGNDGIEEGSEAQGFQRSRSPSHVALQRSLPSTACGRSAWQCR